MQSLKILGKVQSHVFGIQCKQEVFIPLPLLCVCVCVFMCLCVWRMLCDWRTVFRHAGGISRAYQIFEEALIFWQDRAPPHFYTAVWGTMNVSEVSIELEWHVVPLTLQHYIA